MDKLEILITAGLNQNKSVTEINKNIKAIEKKIQKLKLQAILDRDISKSTISKEIEKLNKQKRQLYVDLKLRKDTLKKQYQELQKESNLTLSVNTSTAEKNIKNVGNTITGTTNETAKLGVALKNTLSDFGLTVSARVALELVRKAANEATAAVKEYDEYTKNLKIITNKDDVSDLIADYATKSLDMKINISEYEQASEVILRAGKNLSESAEYTETAIKLAKTGFIESDVAAENLITIANSYDLTADKLKNVTDTLLTLDVQTNTEAGSLSSAMAKSAKNAQLAGLSYEQLGATIAKLRDTTGKTEAEIATSLNNIFNRTYRVKPNTFTLENENGETEDLSKPLSDVEKVVNQLGISIRKSATEFKDFEEIISTIAPIWKDLDSVSQNALSSVFAGQHKNVFLNLVNDWQDIVELTKTAENSFNATETKYNAYLDSLEAKSAEFSTTSKELWNNLIPDGFIGDLTEAGTATLKFADDYKVLQTALKSAVFYGLAKGAIATKNSFAGMVTDIKNVSYAMDLASRGSSLTSQQFNALGLSLKGLSDKQQKLILSTKSLTEVDRINLLQLTGLSEAEAKAKLQTLGLAQANETATTATFSLSGTFKSLWGVIAASPVMALTIAFTAVSTIITTVKQKQEEYRQSIKDTAKETKELTDNLNSLYASYSDMKIGVDNGTSSKEDLTEATNKLLEALGYESSAVDDLIAKYGDLHTAINQATADRLKESLPDLANAVDVELDELTHKANIQASMSFTIDKNDANKKITDFLNDFTSKNNTEFIKVTNKVYNEYSAPYATDIGKKYSFVQIFNNDLDNSVDGIKKRLDELNLLKQELFDYFGAEDVQNVDLYKTVNNQIANLSASYDEYTTALSDYNNTAAEAQIVQSLVGKEIPKTVEEYKKYRSELIKSANDSKEYIGSQEDIINSIDGTLSKMNEFADVQNRLNNLETAKDKFVVGKVNSKPISDFINSLSDDDLSILIQLDTSVFDNGLDGAEQAIENFKNNPNNQISVDVETSEADTSSLDKLQEAYDDLSKSADSYTKSQKTLTDALKEQKEHGQLSADTIKNLSEAGYSQALTVDKETGAVTLNMEAYNRLNEQKKQKIKLDLEQQNTELETQLQKEESAISSLKMEYQALATANAQANAERLKQIEIELTQHSQDKAKLQDLVDKNNSVSISLDAPTFDNSGTKTDVWKETAEKKFADLEHLYAMDKISYASYLNQLDKLNQYYYGNREKYLDEFRKNEEKVYQGRKKLNEDLIAEEEKRQKAYHDNRLSELETQITVAENKSVDNNGNSLNPSEKFDYIRASYSDLIAENERRINEIMQSGIEGHEDEVKELERQIEEYADKLQDVFKDEIDYEIKYIETTQKKYNDFIDKRIAYYEDGKKALEDMYDTEIKSIDDTIDALKDKNDAASKAIELKKAEQDLENAQQRTRMVYGADGSIGYSPDTDKIQEAQQKVDDIKLDMVVSNLEKQKEALEEQKDIEIDRFDNMITTLNEQKDIQEKYFETLIEILSNYSNPKAAENIKSVWNRIFADKENVKINGTTANVKGTDIDTSNAVFGEVDADKVNQTLDKADEVVENLKENNSRNGMTSEEAEDFVAKILYKTPEAYERYKRGEYGNILEKLSGMIGIGNSYNPAKSIVDNINQNNSKMQSVNIKPSVSVGELSLNIQTPVGTIEDIAKHAATGVLEKAEREAMMQIPNAFMKQMYTNLK